MESKDIDMKKGRLDGVRGVIFDYGGTLDTRGDHWSYLIEEAYVKAGVIVDANGTFFPDMTFTICCA